MILIVVFLIIGALTIWSITRKMSIETHKGDLIIDGNETYLIENKKDFHVDGNIIVKDNARLIIRNSKLTLDITSFASFWVDVEDNASLEVDNSTLDRAIKMNVNLRMDGKELIIKNSSVYWDISAETGAVKIEDSEIIGSNGIFWKGYQSVNFTLTNSHIKIVQLSFLNPEPESITLENLKPGTKDKFSFKTKGGASLAMANSTIDGWVIEQYEFFDGQANKVNLTIKDSEIYLWLWFRPGTKLVAKDFRPGMFSDWQFSKNVEAQEVDYDIHLINSKIGGEKVAKIKLLIAGEANLDRVKAQIGTWGSADVIVNNSQIEMGLMLRGNETVHLNNTVIASGDIEFIDGKKFIEEIGGAKHKVYFSNSKIITKDALEVACDESFISGDVEFDGPNLDKLNWDRGIVTREYSFVAIPNSQIMLYDQNNRTVWQGKTGGDGSAKFQIVFNKDNFKQNWRLETEGKQQKINFLTNTPINLR